MELYGQPVKCVECKSDNVVERWRWRTMPSGMETELPYAVCRTCGHERSL